MAVLTRPLFHSQERIDLEDLNQLLSGLRTDARLLSRQVYGDKNLILKGFDSTGIGTTQITVNLFDSTVLFAGRGDLEGVATVTVDDAAANGAVITISNSDSTVLTITAIASGTPTDEQFVTDSDPEVQAENLRIAIDAIGDFAAVRTGSSIAVTASRTGYLTINISDTTGFNAVGNVIGTFDYSGDIAESPADLSYFILQSSATGPATRLTEEITSGSFAPTGTASRTLYVYGTLETEQGTPITKAFWDPSANSGSGAEFNQRVNTASELAMSLNVSQTPLPSNSNELFANVPVCEIEVDTSGIIISIRDVRPLLFEADDNFAWPRTSQYVEMDLLQTVQDASITAPGETANADLFTLDEIVDFFSLTSNTPSTSAVVQFISGTAGNDVLRFDKLDLSAVPSRQSYAKGRISGATRIVDRVTSNFFRDDKSIGNFRDIISALATEIKNVKGTDRWYDDPTVTVRDLLRFINSTVIGIQPNARYEWNATGAGDGTLAIKLDPINDPDSATTITVNPNNSIADGSAITFIHIGPDVILQAIASGTPGTNEFLIGSDSEATASNIVGAINSEDAPGLSATFAETGTLGEYVINIGSNDRDYTNVISTSPSLVVTPLLGAFTYLDSDTNLANIKFYGATRDFFIREINLTIATDEVLFVTLPDLNDSDEANSLTPIVYNQPPFRYSASGPQVDASAWNTTNRNLFVNDTDRFKTVPVANFESNDRNYWLAYRDSSSTIFVRDVGELGDNESANIGQGITNASLSYIGAPDENDSTPEYASVTAIQGFTGDGAYTAGSADDFNESIVAQSENLTSAVNDLNNHLSSLKDTQYQNEGMQLIGGGFWNWEIVGTTGSLDFDAEAFISVPGITNERNTLQPPSGSIFMADGDVVFVDIERIEGSANNLTLALGGTPTEDFEPRRDRIVIARRLGDYVYIGVNGSMRLAAGEAAPLDGALQFFGLNSQSQLPRQLNTHTGIGDQVVDIGTSDVAFRAGGQNTPGDISDDEILLALSIGSGVLYWEGASLDFGGFTGNIYDEGTTNNFRNRMDSQTFSLNSPAAGDEVWYSISLTGDTTITDTDDDLVSQGGVIPDSNIGRKKGELDIAFGTTAAIGFAVPPEFSGTTPVAQVRVSREVGASDLNTLVMGDVIVLGASGGGGGGGTGNANQDLNNYLNRLNLSTFEYLTPVIAASSIIESIDTDNTDAALSASGFAVIADTSFQTTQLLDPDFLGEDIDPNKVEIQGTWFLDTSTEPVANRVDPNAKWYISNDSGDSVAEIEGEPVTPALSITVDGVVTSAGVQLGNIAAGITISDENVITASNHGLSTGHKINFSDLGDLTIQDPDSLGGTTTTTVYYVHVINEDAFSLHRSRQLVVGGVEEGADEGSVASRQTIDASTIGSATINRDAGVMPRVDVTNLVRAVYTFEDASVEATRSIRIRIVGDTDADLRNQANDGLLSSLAVFYSDEVAETGPLFNSLEPVNQILRSNHLYNEYDTNASYAVAGRGIQLFDTNGDTKELSISADDKLRIDGTELSTGHIIEDSTGTDLDERANLQFIGATVTDDSANDRTVVTVGSAVRLTQTGGTNTSGNDASAASQSSFHWIAPAGVFSIKLWLTSAGGTGGVGPNPIARPGGGAGGGTIITTLQVVEGERYELLIGDDNPGISDAGGSNRGGRNGGATVFKSPSGSTTALIDGKNREVLVSGGSGGGRSGAGATSDGGRFSSGTNTGTIDTTSSAVNFQVEVNAIGGRGSAANISPGNNSPGGGSFYENGGALAQHDGNERGSGGAGFLGFPGSESSGGAGSGGRGGVYIEYFGPASIINSGLTP